MKKMYIMPTMAILGSETEEEMLAGSVTGDLTLDVESTDATTGWADSRNVNLWADDEE